MTDLLSPTAPRDRCRLLFARQIATFNGWRYERMTQKQQIAVLTLAENLLATVERLATVKPDWSI